MKKKKLFDFSLLVRVLKYTSPYKKIFIFSCIFGILLAGISPLRPILLQKMIDDYIPINVYKETNFTLQNLKTGILYIFFAQIGILILETFFKFIFSIQTAFLGQSVIKDLRKKVFGKILSFNVRQFDKTPIGTLTTRTINDIEAINQIFSDGFIPILIDLLTIIVVLTTMFLFNWKLTLITLMPFPFLLLATYYFKESVNKSFHKVRNAVAALNAFVQEHISGMAIIKSFAAEERESEKFKQINDQHRKANIKAIMAYSIFFPIVEIVSAISIALIMAAALKLPIEPGSVAFYFVTLNLIFRPLRFIADKFNTLQMGMIAAERVFKILDNTDITLDKGTIHNKKINGNIVFKDIHFSYIPKIPVLKNINFQLEAGKTLAIVGHTGSGKSTIIGLLNRMYDVQEGNILLDNHSIKSYSLECLRSNIGIVSQDLFLLSDSIYNNVTLYNTSISKKDVQYFAKMIDVHDFIMRLPNQYDYQVKERGGTLSYGQRQLICFLRILAYDSSIFLFDEATSSIDSQSEKLIQKAIDTVVKNRTSIIIAHRLSTIQKADNIIVLDKGQIVEQGTHNTLYAKQGYYYEMCQSGEEILLEN